MITWAPLLPLMILPTLLIGALGLLPELHLAHIHISGESVRLFFVAHVLSPFLTSTTAGVFAQWYAVASAPARLALHGLIAVNINAALLPVLYGAGVVAIRFFNWFRVFELETQRQHVKGRGT